MSINSILNEMDQKLNLPGEIPVISTFTGAFRVTVGVVETVAGIAMGIFGLLASIFRHTNLLKRSADHSLNGMMNVFRGSVEMVPVAGNLLMLFVNRLNTHKYDSILEREQPLQW